MAGRSHRVQHAEDALSAADRLDDRALPKVSANSIAGTRVAKQLPQLRLILAPDFVETLWKTISTRRTPITVLRRLYKETPGGVELGRCAAWRPAAELLGLFEQDLAAWKGWRPVQ